MAIGATGNGTATASATKEQELMSRFHDTHIFREQAFSLGIDRETNEYFLSTPVSGALRAVEFEGFFQITREEYYRFCDDLTAAIAFAEACQMGRHQDRRLT